MKRSLCYRFKIKTFAVAMTLAATGLTSCQDDELVGQPSWLNNSIYGYLQEQGNYEYLTRLINDVDMTDVLNMTGSKTLFAADDAAFETFFKSNSWNVNSYDELSAAQKKILLNSSMVNNAYLIELLSNVPGNPPQEGMCMRREVALSVYDSVARIMPADMPNTRYWDKVRGRKDGVLLMRDNTSQPMIHLLPRFMKTNKITDSDLAKLTNGHATSASESWVNGIKVLTPTDITCKNGYVQKVEQVITPADNMAEIIHKHPIMSRWAELLDLYSAPIYDANATQNYNRLYGTQDSVFVLRYFAQQANGGSNLQDPDNPEVQVPGYLTFDPGWNQYMYTNAYGKTLEYDFGAMLVPNNDAVERWWNGEGRALQDVYPSLAEVDVNVLNKLINVNMITSFVDHVPSKFESITNDAKVSMGVKPEDVDSCFMGCNGVVYLTNKVFAPAAYRSVSFPALVRRNTTMGVVYWAIEQLGLDAYLNSMDTRYSLVLPTNDAFLQYIDPVSYGKGTSTLYQFFWDEERQNVRADKYQYDMATGQILDPEHYESAYANAPSGKDNDPIMNRLNDIMENAIVVGDIEDGHTYYKTKGGSILKVTRGGQNGVMISGGLQVEQNNPVEVTTIYDQTESGNGKAYVIEDRLLMPSRKSVYTTLSEHPEYTRFLELLSGGDPDSTEYSLLTALIDEKYECVDQNITLFDTYNYTVYVPTNEAIEKLHEEGILPYWTDFDAATDEGLRYKIKNRIVNFLRYHIQDNSVFIGDNTESGLKYETGMLNPANRRFYSIEVNKIGTDGMELTDQLGNKRKVVTTEGLYNNVCREYAFNTGANTIYTSSSAVVHQIDGALFYEKSQLEKIEY